MADTSSNVQFKVENGLFVLGTANLAGPVFFTSNVTIGGGNVFITANVQSNVTPLNNSYSLGNTTARWALNAMTGDFVGAVGVTNTLAVGNTTITGFINVTSTANVGGATTLRDTLTVNGAVTIGNTLATGNVTLTGFANIVGATATFNANTGVANTTDFITTTAAHGFSDGDLVRYVVSTGNTAVGGLSNGANYFVVSSNSTALKLSATYGGANIDITAGTSETGHTLVPQRIRFSTSGNIDTSIGLANVGSLRVLGTAVVDGATTINNTLATGNTTVTGFINVSSTANVGGAVNLRNILTVNGAVTVGNTLATGNTTVTGFINVSSTANVGGATTLRDTLAVNGAVTISNTLAVGNTTITGFANIVGASATFNANTGVANATDFITTTAAHGFSDGDLVQYVVSAGNTAITGLSNGVNYFVVSSNSTALKLASSFGGANIDITASATSETGHTLVPQRIRFSTSGNIDTSIGLANVGSLRVLGAAIVNGATTIGGATTINNTLATGNVTITGFANVSTTLNVTGVATFAANVTFDTDLLFLDGVNNRVGFKNAAPTSDLISINGNTVITSANAAIRFLSGNATHNAHVSLAGNTTYSRLTVTTYEANATANDGGFLFQSVNSSVTTAILQYNQTEFKYKSGNVAHSGNFGIYDVNGTRLGP